MFQAAAANMEEVLAAMGVSVSSEQSEEQRVLAERMAEYVALGELPLKRARHGGWEYVEGTLLPAKGLERLADLARGTGKERRSLEACLRGRRAEGDELGAALVRATLKALGSEEDEEESSVEEEPPRKSVMEHKAAHVTASEMDASMAAAPRLKHVAPPALPRQSSNKNTEWRPVDDSDASSSDDDGDTGRVRRLEQIEDDSEGLRERIEGLVAEGELGESDDEGDGETWLRPRTLERLYPHQVQGVRWLEALHRREEGGIVGDEMGLGKTALVAAFLAAVFDSRSASLTRSVLVLAPTTMLAHWRRELGRGRLVREWPCCTGAGGRLTKPRRRDLFGSRNI